MTTRRGPLCTAATAAALAAAALATTGCPSALSKLAARIEPFDPDETPGALKELDDWMRAHVEDKESAHAHLVAARGHFDWLLYAMDREDVGLMADLAERLGKRSACAGETAITPACFSSALAEVHELFDAVRVRDLPSEEKPEAESGTDLSDPAGLAGLGSDYVRTLAVAAVGHRGMASRAVALKLVHARAVLREAKKAGEDGLVARLAAAWPFPCPAHFADLPALHGDALADALEHCDLMEGYRGGAPSERALLDEHHDAKPAVVAVASAAVAAPPVDAAGVAAAKAAGAVASGDAAGAAAAKAAAERAAAAAEAAEAERAAAAAEAERAAAAAEAERAAAAAAAAEAAKRADPGAAPVVPPASPGAAGMRPPSKMAPPSHDPFGPFVGPRAPVVVSPDAPPPPPPVPPPPPPDAFYDGTAAPPGAPPATLPAAPDTLPAPHDATVRGRALALPVVDIVLKAVVGDMADTARTGKKMDAPFLAKLPGQVLEELAGLRVPAPVEAATMGVPRIGDLSPSAPAAPPVLLSIGPDGARVVVRPTLAVGTDGTLGPAEGPGKEFAPPGLAIGAPADAVAALERAWKATGAARADGVGLALQGGMKWSDAVPVVRALADAGVPLHLVASPDGLKLRSVMMVKFVAADSVPPAPGPEVHAEVMALVVGTKEVTLVRWGGPASLGVTLPLVADGITDASSVGFALEGAATLWEMSPTDVKRLLIVPEDGAAAGVVAEVAAAAATLPYHPTVELCDRLLPSHWPGAAP